MTVASELIKLKDNLTDSYTAVENKGGTLPQAQNFDNLPDAIDSITTGGTIDSLNITPTTSQQTITATGGTDGYSPITVEAVTSSIDANIVASNIKDGVTILGVTGDYQGSGTTYPGLGVKCYITPGLSPYFEIPSGSYEDYTVNYQSYTGCLGTVGDTYLTGKDASGVFSESLTNIGCNMTDEGIVSGFGRSGTNDFKGLLINDAFPSTITQFDFITKAQCNNTTSRHNIILGGYDEEKDFVIRGNNMTFSFYDGSWTNGVTVLQNNQWYWYRVTFDGTTVSGYVLLDNDYTLDTLPDLSNWSNEWYKNTDVLSNKKFIIGCNRFSSGEYWDKNIDLSQTLLTINDNVIYSYDSNMGSAITTAEGILKSGLSDQSSSTDYNIYFKDYYELDTSTQNEHFGGVVTVPAHTAVSAFPPTFSIKGFLKHIKSPAPGVGYGLSNFSKESYIKSTINYRIPSSAWTTGVDIYLHFKTPKSWEVKDPGILLFYDLTGETTEQTGNWNRGIYFDIENNSGSKCVWFCLGYNNSRYCSMYSTGLSLDTEYWVRVSFPDTTYFAANPIMLLSTDNWNTFTQVGSGSYSTGISDIEGEKDVYVGNAFINGTSDKSYQKSGIIYPSGTYIKIGNTTIWNMGDIDIGNSWN